MPMPQDFLDTLLTYKRSQIKNKAAFWGPLQKRVKDVRHNRYHIFRDAIAKPGRIRLIAEIKKASPSVGIIRDPFDVRTLAHLYAQSGADAISVLTETKYFLGKPVYVRDVSLYCPLPVLAKDFFIDDVQIYEAFQYGASAILLIAAILNDAQMKRLYQTAANLDMDCLVEVHNETELKRALDMGAAIIGINNRDLHTFQVDLSVGLGLIPKVPKDKIIVAESGIRTHDDVLAFERAGANAVLIGETFLQQRDVAGKVKELMGGAYA
jgi:indole-3-glycerol phosphate synthase